MASDDLNLNIARCLQDVNDFGVKHIHNICSGTITDVPWGSADWLGFCGAAAFGILFAAMLLSLVVMFIRDM